MNQCLIFVTVSCTIWADVLLSLTNSETFRVGDEELSTLIGAALPLASRHSPIEAFWATCSERRGKRHPGH